MHETILIIDYGSQYTQLIARRLRECEVFCIVKPYNKINSNLLKNLNLSGIILSGGPNSVLNKKAPKLNTKILNLNIKWKGKGLNEKCYLINGRKKELIIKVDKKYFRPNEVHYLRGNASKALRSLNFKPKYSFLELVEDMVKHDLELAEEELI